MAALRRAAGRLLLLSLVVVLCSSSTSKPALTCSDDSDQRCAADVELQQASGRSSTRVLNAERRVFSVDGFVSDAEMDHVISVAAAQFTEDMGGSEAWRTAGQYMSTELRDWADDPVLRTIEERVARVVKFQCTRNLPSWLVTHLHHAGQCQLVRRHSGVLRTCITTRTRRRGASLTALVYLTDVADGGQTVFPCHGSDGNGTESKTITSIRERFVEAYLDSKRILFPPSDRDCFDAALFTQTEAMCDDSETSGVLAIRPKRGRGLFFASVRPDGSADRRCGMVAVLLVQTVQVARESGRFRSFANSHHEHLYARGSMAAL